MALLLGPPTAISGAAWALGSSNERWLPVYAMYIGTLVASVVIYRLSPLHPLARVPGPLLFKVSKIWMGTRCAMGMESRLITALHEEYGDIVRTGTWFIILQKLPSSSLKRCRHGQMKYPSEIHRSSTSSWELRARLRVPVRAFELGDWYLLRI